jgi:glycosyltransferase involved in cell wall biosynthesis
LAAEDEVLVSVGRQSYQKGQIHMLDAMAELVRVRPRLVWVLAGAEGDATDQLVARRAALGLAGQVRYLGLRNDVAEVLAAADVFVHPSLYEGFPGALLEAMALGLPAVASDIAPVREAAEVDRTALVVPAGSPTLLAGAITTLLDHPDRAAAFGTRARKVFLDCYTAERSAARMAALLEQVAARAARQRRPWRLTPPAVSGLD